MTSALNDLRGSGVAAVSTHPDSKTAPWVERLQRRGLTITFTSLECCLGAGVGVSEDVLERAASAAVVSIEAPRGGDRVSAAAAIHQRADEGGDIFVKLDGARAGIDGMLGAVLEDLHGVGPAATLFVDNGQDLSGEAWVSLRRVEANPRPRLRLLVGFESGVAAPTLDAEVRVVVPPLTDRPGDIAALVEQYFGGRKSAPRLEPEALDVLRQAAWPGDADELRCVLDRLALLHAGSDGVSADGVAALLGPGASSESLAERKLADLEREHIYRVLDANSWNRTRSAKILGIDVKTLYNKLKRYESKAAREASQ